MVKISVVLAVYNEEDNLKRCLESVKDLAEEIVVVDGGSSDKTVEIAKEFKARVTIVDNPLIFHINKQKAIEKARGDWVLQLDADEAVTKLLSKEILKAVNSEPAENGFWVPRRNWFLGRFLTKGGQYPDYTLRLYRRGKGRLPCKSVHEQAEVEGKTGYLKNDLLHYADPNFKRYWLRWRRYTNLTRDELRESGKGGFLKGVDYLLVKPIWWFGLTYFRHKGFMDSWQGFIFSFFSALRFPTAYIKYLKTKIF